MDLKPEEMKAAEAALLAEEQAIKEKWCQLKGHVWPLPGANPFTNGKLSSCEVVCNRCNARATVTVALLPKRP